jgi:hypothetical protein
MSELLPRRVQRLTEGDVVVVGVRLGRPPPAWAGGVS